MTETFQVECSYESHLQAKEALERSGAAIVGIYFDTYCSRRYWLAQITYAIDMEAKRLDDLVKLCGERQ